MADKKNSKFITLESSKPVEDDKGNIVTSKHMRIDQLNDDGSVKSSSYHIKVLKISHKEDGSQRGDPKQVFFPVVLRKRVSEQLMTLKLDEK